MSTEPMNPAAGAPAGAPPPAGAPMAPPGPMVATGPSGPRAGFWIRVGGYLLDAILVGIVGGVLEVALKGPGYALAVIISAAYFTYFFGDPRGQTLGQRAVGIRVIDANTGGPIGYGRAFVRWIGLIISGWVILLGFLWMLWDREKQTWADKMATTVVVPVSAYPIT